MKKNMRLKKEICRKAQWGKMGGTAAMNISTCFSHENSKSIKKRLSGNWIIACAHNCQLTMNLTDFDWKMSKNFIFWPKLGRKIIKKCQNFGPLRVPPMPKNQWSDKGQPAPPAPDGQVCVKSCILTSWTIPGRDSDRVLGFRVTYWPKTT